ncbi:hypothetical protein CRUP_017438 [Coryphaenoides rupestris]|nr:hypothetical protein CRUP_017438 [Coryphaenoides rupestris]
MISLLHNSASRSRRLQGFLQTHMKILFAGVQTYDRPPDFSDVVLPDKPKLKFLNKVPNLKKAKKEPRKLRDIQGPEKTANTFIAGNYGILMDSRSTFARWRVSAPYKPITRKGLGQRMGGGKGAIDHYVTPVRAGRLVVELGGRVELAEVELILTEVAKKLPFPAKVVSRESLASMQVQQEEKQHSNQNRWTFRDIVRGNMLGIRKFLSPFDLRNHGRFTGKFYLPDRV